MIWPIRARAVGIVAPILLIFTNASVGQPINDSILSPTSIASLPYTDTVDNTLATWEDEFDEPLATCGTDGLNSVWWRYTATANQILKATTIGSDFDTILSVYLSTPVLVEIGCDDDSGGGTGQSQEIFSATNGSVYYFRVVGNGATSGNVVMNLSTVTPDDLAGAVTVVEPLPFADTLSTVGATTESGESLPTCGSGGTNSVWWRYTPTASTALILNTNDSDFDTILSVHTGSSHPLTEVACDDDGGSPAGRSQLTFLAKKDTTYYFRVSGFNGDDGDAALNILIAPPDDLAGAVPIDAIPFTDTLSNVGAGVETNEAAATCGSDGGNSIWWRYTAGFSGTIVADTDTSGFDTILSVHTGTDHPLTEIACDDDGGSTAGHSRASFSVTSGTTYYFRVVGSGGADGDARFRLRMATFSFAGNVLLEGPYDTGGQMGVTVGFSAATPLDQPYSDAAYDGTEHDYDGSESVVAFPDTAIDWLLISLRTGTEAGSEVAGSEQAVILLEDGSLLAAEGDQVRFEADPGSYYVVLRHRNHLSVMSSSPVDFSSGAGTWDFTSAETQAFGPSPMKEVDANIWAMFSAEATLDDLNNANDFNAWLTDTKAASTGYLISDFNLDGQVTAADFNLWLANTKAAASSGVP